MAKLIIEDDVGARREFNTDDLLKDHEFRIQAGELIMAGVKHLPVGKERSGILDALRTDAMQQFIYGQLFHCECDTAVLMSNVKVVNDEAMCVNCAKREASKW